jgi:hypothetical protein
MPDTLSRRFMNDHLQNTTTMSPSFKTTTTTTTTNNPVSSTFRSSFGRHNF